jgi:hypothetical protein
MLLALLARSGFPMPATLWLLFLLVVVTMLVVNARKAKQAFQACGVELGLANAHADAQSVSGDVDGLHVVARVIPGGKNSPPHMSIEVGFTPCDLLLDLRPTTRSEQRAVAAGEAVDVQTGDAAFDAAWIVEGAPERLVVRALGDAAIRGRLIELASIVEARVTIEDGLVTIYRRGSDVADGRVDATRIRLALDLARSARLVSEEPLAEAPPPPDDAAATYRSAGPRPPREPIAENLRKLKELRAARALRGARFAILAGHLLTPGAGAVLMGTSIADGQARGSVELAVFGGLALGLATGLSQRFLNGLRRGAPSIRYDELTRSTILASWAIYGVLCIVTLVRAV